MGVCLEPPFRVPQVESPGWFGVADNGLVGVATVLGKALGLGRCAGARNASGAEDASVRAARRVRGICWCEVGLKEHALSAGVGAMCCLGARGQLGHMARRRWRV